MRHKEILHNCMSTMNISSNVKILYSQKICSPSLCGLLKPKILIPFNVAHNVCDGQVISYLAEGENVQYGNALIRILELGIKSKRITGTTSNEVRTDIYFYENGIGYFNQDLSNNSALIEIGNNMSSDSDIEACINALVSALKNTSSISTNK